MKKSSLTEQNSKQHDPDQAQSQEAGELDCRHQTSGAQRLSPATSPGHGLGRESRPSELLHGRGQAPAGGCMRFCSCRSQQQVPEGREEPCTGLVTPALAVTRALQQQAQASHVKPTKALARPSSCFIVTETNCLTLRPRCCLQCSESLAGLQVGRSTEQGDHEQLKELYSAGNLTVLANDSLLHQDPVQLDFYFRLTPQASAHWHGLLCDHRLFLDIPYRALDQGNRESLTATLEYVEEKTDVDSVFVNFHNARNDRGALLRAFSYMGFEVVRPDHPALPPWDNVIFMVYPLERDCGHLSSKPS
ncbi:LOW QUALITY PROTEIN: ornithine decarboxylase antizyme 3 [Petaurus breviceps papuanus]|uniref:LOW QUALITY PROTEIN: ornithine decarboxylase antizyme 3 n=1 Tax=Petaurus breviceps papuanus TaxID=3040969 RepID=UPI0036D7DF1E